MLAVEPERVERGLQAGDMTVVVRAPDIDGLVKAAGLELVAVIGDVGGEIGIKPVGAAQNVVLEAELFDILRLLPGGEQLLTDDARGAQPQSTVLFIGIAVRCQLPGAGGDVAVFVQRRFIEPLVIVNPRFLLSKFHLEMQTRH